MNQKVLFVCDNIQTIYRVYTREQIGDAPVISTEELRLGLAPKDTAYLFSTWGMPKLSEAEIREFLPNLKIVFYGAGSVQYFVRPYLACGVRVFSAWAANAIPVAEYTLGQILLANKGYFQLSKRYKEQGHNECSQYAAHFAGNYGVKVGLLGAGMIGKKVIELLKPFEIEVMVFDPFLPEEKAAEMGVTKATLPEIFEQCPVVSNHLANNEQTKGMLNYDLFSRMPEYSTFINTGRNSQVVMEDLMRAMKEVPTRTALLDVTDPDEPLPPDHPAWQIENIFITPHRAGSVEQEIFRMGKFMYEQYQNVLSNQPTMYEVTEEMLQTMA